MNNTILEDYDDYGYSEIAGLRKTMNTITIVIYSLAFVLGVTGNGLVIFITGFRMKKTVNTVWFLNLAIADFTFTLFLPFSIAYITLGFHWPFGQAMCKFNTTLTVLNLYASVYLLMVISIDRCISVRYPVWAQNHRSPRLASFVTVGIWIVALVLSSPNFHFKVTGPHSYVENATFCFTHYSHNLTQSKMIHHAMITSRFIFAFIIPFTVIVVCYGMIVLKLQRNRLTQSTKPFKVITAVIVAFFLCWLPYHIFSFIETKADETPGLHLVLPIAIPLTSSLAFINSCLNPILYVFMGHDFKDRLKRSLFSAFENVFAETASESTSQTKVKSSIQLDSQDLTNSQSFKSNHLRTVKSP
ncbi:chemerin-like receptor 1 [Anolis carolinensis]|uniref:G-protein coupled receptors family 1 profile domain-containing protein n=1 Tax=Anolis carolinensis TaxID=28377 RepID=H9G9C6_ANOCA|nr:PREDICTED: chemokine-like receptor 1 [Anolis carolinensis]|eukprot:XP_003228256.1 PREDICTED: chemokine-like receptor 1 [Anolis carolinensis]